MMSCSTTTRSYSAMAVSDYNKSNYSSLLKPSVHSQFIIKSTKQQGIGTLFPILKQTTKDTTKRTTAIASCSCSGRKIGSANASSGDILRLMDGLNLPTSPDMYASLIKECALSCDSTNALHLHAHLFQSGLTLTLPMINRLLLMYVSCGHLDIARYLFDQMTVKKDFNSWAIIFVAYFSNARYEDTINLFLKMLRESNNNQLSEFPTWVIVGLLKACLFTMNMGLGKQLHGLSLKLGITNNLSVSRSLLNLYGKFRCLEDANLVFDQLLHRNTVIWTAKIANNCREGYFSEVINDFIEMGRAGIRKNMFTFSSVLRACARMDDGGSCGQQVHAHAIKLGLESDVFVQCGLIDMYGKCGIVLDAKKVFDTIIDKKNSAYCNSILMSYVHNGFYIEAFKFLYQMEVAGIQVQKSLINKVRIACGSNASATETERTGYKNCD